MYCGSRIHDSRSKDEIAELAENMVDDVDLFEEHVFSFDRPYSPLHPAGRTKFIWVRVG